MKKYLKVISAMVLVLTLIMSTTVFATDNAFGAAGALIDEDYIIEEMLNYAIEDEYGAKAEYEAIMEKYDVTRPFSNIIKAESKHIELLTPLFEKYGYVVPVNDAAERVYVPATLEEAYKIGVEAEVKNIEMYEQFLKEDLPEDIKDVFQKLLNASEKHLAAYERGDSSSNRNTRNLVYQFGNRFNTNGSTRGNSGNLKFRYNF